METKATALGVRWAIRKAWAEGKDRPQCNLGKDFIGRDKCRIEPLQGDVSNNGSVNTANVFLYVFANVDPRVKR